MKRLIYILPILVISCIITSCDKMPKNGDLDGMWQILTIEKNGTTTDVKDQQLYLSFQLALFELTSYRSNLIYYGYFNHKADTIIFRQFSDMAEEHPEAPDNYPIPADSIHIIQPWGFYSIIDTFKVEYLTKDNMTLSSKSARITYRKF